MGSIGFINTDFVKKMEAIGIHCRVFNPFMPGLNLFLNNREKAENRENMGNMEAEERKEEGTPSGETLEAAFGKLDQMLETLESSDVSLEDSFRLYKEGMELLNECSQKIDRVEKKMLQMNEDGTFREF